MFIKYVKNSDIIPSTYDDVPVGGRGARGGAWWSRSKVSNKKPSNKLKTGIKVPAIEDRSYMSVKDAMAILYLKKVSNPVSNMAAITGLFTDIYGGFDGKSTTVDDLMSIVSAIRSGDERIEGVCKLLTHTASLESLLQKCDIKTLEKEVAPALSALCHSVFSGDLEYIVVPAGWHNAVRYLVVERTCVTIVSAGGGGIEYHPCFDEKVVTCWKIGPPNTITMTDPVFWYSLLRQRVVHVVSDDIVVLDTHPMRFYEGVLPEITCDGLSMYEATINEDSVFEKPCRSANSFRMSWTLAKYAMRKNGYTKAERKTITYGIRLKWLKEAMITVSNTALVKQAGTQVAACTVKELRAGRVTETEADEVNLLCEGTLCGVDVCEEEPSFGALDGTMLWNWKIGVEQAQHSNEVDRKKDMQQVLNMGILSTCLPGVVPNIRACSICVSMLHDALKNETLSKHHALSLVCAAIEYTMLKLPCPPASVWSDDVDSDILEDINFLSRAFVCAVSVVEWRQGSAAVISASLYAAYDIVVRAHVPKLSRFIKGVPSICCRFNGHSFDKSSQMLIMSAPIAKRRGEIVEYFNLLQDGCRMEDVVEEMVLVDPVVEDTVPEPLPFAVNAPPPPPQPLTTTTESLIREEKEEEIESGLWDWRRIGGVYMTADVTTRFCSLVLGAKDTLNGRTGALCSMESGQLQWYRDVSLLATVCLEPLPWPWNVPDDTVEYLCRLSWSFYTTSGKAAVPEAFVRILLNGNSLAEDQSERIRTTKSGCNPTTFLDRLTAMGVTEDDVMCLPPPQYFGQKLSMEEAEHVTMILTTPGLRIPLLIDLMVNSRPSALFDSVLRALIDHVLFEPGAWGETMPDPTQVLVPSPDRYAPGKTPRGLLAWELDSTIHPTGDATLKPLIKLLYGTYELATRYTGIDFESSLVDAMLFAIYAAVSIQGYTSDEALSTLVNDRMRPLLSQWIDRASVTAGNHVKLERLSRLHRYRALSYTHSEHVDMGLLITSCAAVMSWSFCSDMIVVSQVLLNMQKSITAWIRDVDVSDTLNSAVKCTVLSSADDGNVIRWTQSALDPSLFHNHDDTVTFNVRTCAVRVMGHGLGRVPENLIGHRDFNRVFGCESNRLQCSLSSTSARVWSGGWLYDTVFTIDISTEEGEWVENKGEPEWASQLLPGPKLMKVVNDDVVWYRTDEYDYEVIRNGLVRKFSVKNGYRELLATSDAKYSLTAAISDVVDPISISRRSGDSVEVYILPEALSGFLPLCIVDAFVFWKCGDVVKGLRREGVSETWFGYDVTIVIENGIVTVKRSDNNWTLLDLLRLPNTLNIKSLLQIEPASHILVWSNGDGVASVELPRIRLRFTPNQRKLFSEEHVGWYVIEEDIPQTRGIPHSLLLEHLSQTRMILVPNHEPTADGYVCSTSAPKSAELVFAYNIPVVTSLLTPPNLPAALHLFLTKLLARQYEEAFIAAGACASEAQPLNEAESWIIGHVAMSADTDKHPDAHACRLKLFALAVAPHLKGKTPWDVYNDVVLYYCKQSRVSAACALDYDCEDVVLTYAVGQQKAAHSSHRVVETDPPHIPLDYITARLTNRLSVIRAMSEEQELVDTVTPCQMHADGGWRKFAQVLANENTVDIEKFDEGDVFWYGVYPYEKMEGVAVERMLGQVVDDSRSGLDAHFMRLFQLLIGDVKVEGHAGSGPLLARIAARLLYVRQRKLQGTKMFPTVPYRYIHAATVLPYLPRPPMNFNRGLFTVGKWDQTTSSPEMQWCKLMLDYVKEYVLTDEWKTRIAPRKVSLASDVGDGEGLPISNPLSIGLDSTCNLRVLQSIDILPSGTPDTLLSTECIESFVGAPIMMSVGYGDIVGASHQTKLCDGKLPFTLSSHPAAQSHAARSILKRLKEDMLIYSTLAKKRLAFNHLPLAQLLKCDDVQSIDLGQAMEDIVKVERWLTAARDEEYLTVIQSVNALLQHVNQINGGRGSANMKLRRRIKAAPAIRIEHVLAALVSSRGISELSSLNPRMSAPDMVLPTVAGIALHACRLSLLTRALPLCRDLVAGLRTLSLHVGHWRDVVEDVERTSTRLLDLMVSRRQYMRPVDEGYEYDPRFLLFELLAGIQLSERQVSLVTDLVNSAAIDESSVQQMLMGEGKTTVVTPLLAMILADGKQLVTEVMPSSLVPMAIGIARGMMSTVLPRPVSTLSFGRYSVYGDVDECIRESKRLAARLKRVRRQRGVLIASATSVKSVFLKGLEYRASKDTEVIAESLFDIIRLWRSSGVLILDEVDVVLHPLKSELNFPTGVKHDLDLAPQRWKIPIILITALLSDPTVSAAINGGAGVSVQKLPHIILLDKVFYMTRIAPLLAYVLARWLISDMGILSKGWRPVAIKSAEASDVKENYDAMQALNSDGDENGQNTFFSTNDHPDYSEESWTAVLEAPTQHLIELRIDYQEYSPFLFCSGQSMVPDEVVVCISSDGKSFKEIARKATHGRGASTTIRLSSGRSKVTHVKLVMCGISRWFGLQHVRIEAQVPAPRATEMDIQNFLISRQPNDPIHSLPSLFSTNSARLLNCGRDCIVSYIPHCVSKVNRVAYGLLNPDEVDREQTSTRRLCAVPFEGKDTPSSASEFSHPDVLITLTVLAYMHEGLRDSDVRSVVERLQWQLRAQPGPLVHRDAYIVFQKWIEYSGGDILPLHLFNTGDSTQVSELRRRVGRYGGLVSHYLDQIVFPETMKHRKLKLSASAQEVGGTSIFKTRIGFSGTPSSLLPVGLGECHYEKGTEGRIVYILTSPHVVTAEIVKNWSVSSLLSLVASGGYNALIDTGALITGMSNREVAETLLASGLYDAGIDACVYIDEETRTPLVVFRDSETRPPIPVKQCGVPESKRFTFFDQVSCTGVDISQSLSAKAAITISKDVTLRDYAQGAWRMRGLERGQTLHVLLIEELVGLVMESSHTGNLPVDIVAWLTVNSMRSETVQFMQLCQQNLSSVWRNRVYSAILNGDVNDINVFSEKLDHTVASCPPIPIPLGDVVAGEVDRYKQYIHTDEQRRVIEKVHADVAEGSNSGLQVAQQYRTPMAVKLCTFMCGSSTTSTVDDDVAWAASAIELDSEVVQEKEREIEQEQMGEFDDVPGVAYINTPAPFSPWSIEELTKLKDGDLWLNSKAHSRVQFFRTQNWEIPLNVVSGTQLLLSQHHTPLSFDTAQKRRLRNVYALLAQHCREKKLLCAVSLPEAETLRRMLVGLERPNVALLRLSDGAVLGASSGWYSAERDWMSPLSFYKLFNCDTWLSPAEVTAIKSMLRSHKKKERALFFHSVLVGRRRDRNDWVGSPLEEILK